MTSAQAAEALRLSANLNRHLQVIGEVYGPAALLHAIIECRLHPEALRHMSRCLDREADWLEREN